MKEAYPELAGRRETIAQAILAEEERFQQTLKEKIPLLEEAIAQAGPKGLSAEQAAHFYDTHGLSYGDILAACRDKNVSVPMRSDFDRALEELQRKSKGAHGFSKEIFSKDELVGLVGSLKQPTQFTGYAQLSGQGRVLAIIRENRFVDEAQAPAKVGVILDRTPFYGEAGGQVGDAGTLEGVSGEFQVLDTQWVGNILVHEGELIEGKIRKGEPVTAAVDSPRRHQGEDSRS